MDNKIKMIFWGFSPVDYIAMEKKINKASQKGWQLSSLSQYKAIFYYDDSVKIDYRILPSEVKVNNQSLSKFSSSEKATAMLEEGWQLVDGYGHILVFAKESKSNNDEVFVNTNERFNVMRQFAISPAIMNDFLYGFLIIAMSFFSPKIGNFENTQWIILILGILPILSGAMNLWGSKNVENLSKNAKYDLSTGVTIRRILTGLSYPFMCFVVWLMIIISVSGNEGVSVIMTAIGLVVLFFVMYFMGKKASSIKYKM